MLSVREERAVVGGVEVARKTVMAATDEGIYQAEIIETRREVDIDLPGSVPTTVAPSAPPSIPVTAQPYQQPVMTTSSSSCNVDCWVDCCFKCDSNRSWYDLQGKGFWCVLFLLLGYLIVGVTVLALAILYCVCKILEACNSSNSRPSSANSSTSFC